MRSNVPCPLPFFPPASHHPSGSARTDVFDAVHFRLGVVAVQQIGAVLTEDAIAAVVLGVEDVVSAPAVNVVRTAAALDDVVVFGADQRVVAVLAEQDDAAEVAGGV